MARLKPNAFTLVELLTVIGIIGLLLQLILPAVQSARESARRTHCMNNLRQLAIASNLHVQAHNHFPTGGWTHVWVGDPDRGYGKDQPGGWSYNLLPFLEQSALHDLSKDSNATEHRRLGAKMFATPVSAFTCPSRRPSAPWPFLRTGSLINIENSTLAGRSDYAANMGNLTPTDQRARGPEDFDEASQWEDGGDNKTQWVATTHNGIVYQRSAVTPAMIQDGLSNTFLVGEKFLDPEHYEDGLSNGDDHSLYVGFDRDNARSGNLLHPPIRDKYVPIVWLPIGDDELVTDWNFGSAHPRGLHMAYCDGSVKNIAYSIDISVFSATSSRIGQEIGVSK